MGTDTLINGIKSLTDSPLGAAITAGSAGVVVGAAGGSLVTAAVNRKKRRKSRSVRKRNNKRRKNKSKKYKYARTAGKGKDTSSRRIRMTKTGQPYIILASGKARFIKKSSARNSRRRKGGRY